MFRCPFTSGCGYGQPQHSTTTYYSNHSGEHVTQQVSQRPAGAVLQHHVVHNAPPANPRYFDNYPMNANNAMAAANHRYEAYGQTYEQSSQGGTYVYGAGGYAQLRRPYYCP